MADMEIFPSEYQQLELQRSEKTFAKCAEGCEQFGYVFLNTNAAMVRNEKQHIVITKQGVTMFKFFDAFKDASMFPAVMNAYYQGVYLTTLGFVRQKLQSNIALTDEKRNLRIRTSYRCVFPNLSRKDVDAALLASPALFPDSFYERCCIFKEEFAKLRQNFGGAVDQWEEGDLGWSDMPMDLDDKNVNSILQRIVPEYTIIRPCVEEDVATHRGVDDELLIVTSDDAAVRAYRLEQEQINIVNSITKGNRLILACAGSGKSAILIAKCFKAAQMNPEKKFLITCKSKQLMYLYRWYIDRAGLRERNVECMTFHSLCRKLARSNRFALKDDLESWSKTVFHKLAHNKIQDRYYGIFIDEVQLFEQEWYKICFRLLENRESDEHLFVICGDKTQAVKNKQKHGKAPWNAGEGYPNYRGRSIRIEKNYRNCVEINRYINRYAECAKGVLTLVSEKEFNDPDLFLRGRAVKRGIGVLIRNLQKYTAGGEADVVVEAVREAHDTHRIPYDEIAVVTYYKQYSRKMKSWQEMGYDIARNVTNRLRAEHIPVGEMYSDGREVARYGNNDGVSLISFDSVLGLDFRAVIVCGLKPLGDYDKTKYLTVDDIKRSKLGEADRDNIRENLSLLYVACTRARELLYIVQPEKYIRESLYMGLIVGSMAD